MICEQTKVRLFNQLQSNEGYSEADLRVVLKTFEFAARVFAGRFQTCGKPFLAHGIGTSSILAGVHAPAKLVAAGLIHNVYLYGEFGSGVVGSSRIKTHYVRKTLGVEIETYLSRFAEFGIAPHTIEKLGADFPRFDFLERKILLLSLSETLEKLQNLEPLYQSNFAVIQKFLEQHDAALIEMSSALGYPMLAEAFQKSSKEIQSKRIPDVLQTGRAISFFLPPKSFFRRSSNPIFTVKPG